MVMMLKSSPPLSEGSLDERRSISAYVELLHESPPACSEDGDVGDDLVIALLLERSRVLQFLQRREEAIRVTEHARRLAQAAGATTLIAEVEARRASIELDRGDLREAAIHLDYAARIQAGGGVDRDHAPFAHHEKGPSEILYVGRGAAWYRLGEGSTVDLQRRRSLRYILDSLVRHRIVAPGSSLATAELIERGWPGETIRQKAAISRLYVAILALRNEGLREVIRGRTGGYLLDPGVDVQLE
jgi:hypothetical protein